MERPPSSFANATSYLPSPADLLLVFPRLLAKAGIYAENLDMGKMLSGGSIIAEPTSVNITNSTAAMTGSTFVQQSAAAAASAVASSQDESGLFQSLKNIGTVFTYITSKWAITTFATAILLNRTHFYASSRVPLSFNRIYLRFALYILPTLLFVYRIQSLLRAIHCQTSPDWSIMQYGATGRRLDTDFAGEGGFLWWASSLLLFGEDPAISCKAVNMFPLDAGSTRTAGSLALLWPLFLSLGFSQFIETLACALQGRQPLPEVGMTIFEHSLAFAEAEAVVTKPFALDTARFWKPKPVFTPDGTSLTVSRATLSSFANVPPEVLLISVISSFSHLTSNVLAIAGLRARFRLVTTGIWGIAYMSAFLWSFLRFAMLDSQHGAAIGILRFPTVCIVGFIPHLLIIIGIVACGTIYSLAFALTVLSPPPNQPASLTWRERFSVAYENLHANIHLSAITPLTINWHEDFYTAILKVGFTVLTAASEAVYLNEGTRVNVNSMTWLEKKRLQELIARQRTFRQSLTNIPRELHGDAMAEGIEVLDKASSDVSQSASGYARERKTKSATAVSDATRAAGRDNGVGLQQRRGRWTLAYHFLRSISRLLMAIHARVIISVLRTVRITYCPRWLRQIAGNVSVEKRQGHASRNAPARFATPTEPWLYVDENTRFKPALTADLENVVREKLRENGVYEEMGTPMVEEHITDYLYNWWKRGGRWSEVDMSGDYVPPLDDDTTSVVSLDTAATEDEWSDVSDDGQRTPTQNWPYDNERESSVQPESTIDLARLSHLLDPKTDEDRQEARLLARHLQEPGIMTRSRYRQLIEREEARVLTSSRLPITLAGGSNMTSEEEEQVLEEFILNKRKIDEQGTSKAGTWDSGAEGMGSEGPQCVVCQLSPRTVLVWPCLFTAYNFGNVHEEHNPSTAFKNDLPPEPPLDNSSTISQHGILHFDDRPTSLPPQHEEQRDSWRLSNGSRTSSFTRSPERVLADESARLNGNFTPLREPRDRISEYENALTSSVKKRSEGPIFEVIKKPRKPGDMASPITDLPNEILTHALSHLSPNDLAAVSLVSRRFNSLVTTPHAWQVAFARYFPGPEALIDPEVRLGAEDAGDYVRSEKRSFARLMALTSWRTEYIVRTRSLRSMARGKPIQAPSTVTSARLGHTQTPAPIIMYNAETFATINHLHATFGAGLNKRLPRFVHGADDVGLVTSSDPTSGKVDPWGRSDPNFYSQFSERFPGVAEWGLGAGEIVGRPNVMDISQPYGMIYGQGCPEGSCYYRSVEELRGRFIAQPTDLSMPEAGVPKLGVDGGSICSVWLAKSSTIPSLSEGLIGMMMGSAAGVVTACSVGTDGLRGQRLQRGELTARWVLSPGVPVVSIVVDENYSLKRQAQNRIWAVALNALGELFYLTKFPIRNTAPQSQEIEHLEHHAWTTGRTAYWNLIEPSRRTARPDPYNDSETDGSYSPRTSWDSMCLSKDQVAAETKEIRSFIRKQPKDFRASCLGWDMRRRLEVDFAGDDGHYAGEAMVVFQCGLGQDETAEIKRYTRWKSVEKNRSFPIPNGVAARHNASIFGGSATPISSHVASTERIRSDSSISTSSSPERENLVEEWRCSLLSFGGLKMVRISATTLDISTFATMTMSEDPALGFSTTSTASSPYASPMSVASQPASPADIPGQRGRFIAAGTLNGVVLLWDVRAPFSRSVDYVNSIDPIRIIYTESPEISCLGLTALHLIHGGNDGLVQAWDPLASSMQPIKTLNSRFSSRARRRLVQAQASVHGVGINMYAAGAICVDPDPTTLRGAVSLGNQIRYWSYSSSAADQFKSNKRRLRHSERGSNTAVERFSGTGRTNLKDYIANEQYELEREKVERDRQAERLAGRFGVDLLADEDEALAYAAMLSQESLENEKKKRQESETSSALSSTTITPEPSVSGQASSPTLVGDQELDADIAEAIRLSLQENSSDSYGYDDSANDLGLDIPIKYAKGRKSPPRSKASPTGGARANGGSSKESELSDLEFALQLSLAEEQSRKDAEDSFPPLSPVNGSSGGKGKGKMRW
ncbi:hypothetical protein BU24DRAFT_455167 [Aaosphaeria arxii CBS 175.79]|uniref:F-box domain-containing protein n=1 Tax=Aaosphaeria arxii CBS 175.79 TaxID=1450172 RepID=A0A6A5XAW3_9PLEO|nr:uncharacterized protein BU24DRAFT_455167 [Aaosphaeria arxii CBS 175.79]KAF2009986.1 hypothetical protein BU24DRAFT_455167 [Aaosphaeria arxii CBS 175.79]